MSTGEFGSKILKVRAQGFVTRANTLLSYGRQRPQMHAIEETKNALVTYRESLRPERDEEFAHVCGRTVLELLSSSIHKHREIIQASGLVLPGEDKIPALPNHLIDVVLLRLVETIEGLDLTPIRGKDTVPAVVVMGGVARFLATRRGSITREPDARATVNTSGVRVRAKQRPRTVRNLRSSSPEVIQVAMEAYRDLIPTLRARFGSESKDVRIGTLFGVGDNYTSDDIQRAKAFLRTGVIVMMQERRLPPLNPEQRIIIAKFLGIRSVEQNGRKILQETPGLHLKQLRDNLKREKNIPTAHADTLIIEAFAALCAGESSQENTGK